MKKLQITEEMPASLLRHPAVKLGVVTLLYRRFVRHNDAEKSKRRQSLAISKVACAHARMRSVS